MPGKKFEDSEQIRKWIKAALEAGCDSPRKVQDWIDNRITGKAPSIPTIGSVMKDYGYQPVGYKWEQVSGKKGR